MRVAIGMSGGVDSAAAAILLKQQGHEVIGVTMRMWRPGKYRGGGEGSCFGPGEEKNIAAAEEVARRIDIEYRLFDVGREYERSVIEYFRSAYLDGKTPNPCVRCNEIIKFGLLPRLVWEGGIKFDRFATGHYARTAFLNGRHVLLRAVDRAKDQSYFLYRLNQEQLSRLLFPLGDLTKNQAREIVRLSLPELADKADSQDFYAGGKNELIGEPDRVGNIVDINGKNLGTHRGFWNYTIGKRRGLGIGGGIPYYVVGLNAGRNEVVVARREDAVSHEVTVDDMVGRDYKGPCRVKIRSTGEPIGPAFLCGNVCVVEKGLFGVAPGQSAVFYGADSDEIISGGIIV